MGRGFEDEHGALRRREAEIGMRLHEEQAVGIAVGVLMARLGLNERSARRQLAVRATLQGISEPAAALQILAERR